MLGAGKENASRGLLVVGEAELGQAGGSEGDVDCGWVSRRPE